MLSRFSCFVNKAFLFMVVPSFCTCSADNLKQQATKICKEIAVRPLNELPFSISEVILIISFSHLTHLDWGFLCSVSAYGCILCA